jgi:hypothetical protein
MTGCEQRREPRANGTTFTANGVLDVSIHTRFSHNVTTYGVQWRKKQGAGLMFWRCAPRLVVVLSMVVLLTQGVRWLT